MSGLRTDMPVAPVTCPSVTCPAVPACPACPAMICQCGAGSGDSTPEHSISDWASGIDFEIDHHRKWTCGETCFGPFEGWHKYERDTKLKGLPVEPHQSRICELLAGVYGKSGGDKVKLMLDHGAGPFTNLGVRFTCPPSIMTGVDAQVIAVDPLAPLYNDVLNEFGVHNTLRTAFCASEGLTKCVGNGVFDFGIIINALDHSENALAGFIEAIRTTKIGGISCVYSIKNEALHMGGQGFHQWNFDQRSSDRHWIIGNIQLSDEIDVDDIVAPFAKQIDLQTVNAKENNLGLYAVPDHQMFVCYEKTGEVPGGL
eukprot:CAMPEP_0197554170 /NCGR_PEP_ID=MMETSP1320-20131121/10762_1 /TAXON_ID=91990 /ORGANISM="Bolidomonas sp., Strain RCC2347" /LENGTH=313 /DNA_ID=CAMNT_0043115027 /DNA_START=252 /DNA_END=1193 /DNA_ORIENTATION=+